MIRKFTLLLILILLLISITPVMAQPQPARVLFPFYIYPTTAIVNQLIAANTYGNIDVILNPANGVGSSVDANYTKAFTSFKTANVGTFGYILTGWASRSLSSTKTEIDLWKTLYNPDGIFIDEASNDENDIAYYQDLYNYITAKGMRVFVNPGTETIEGYMGVSDNICIYENDPYTQLYAPAWTLNYPASKFCVLQYGASATQMRATVAWALSHNVGYVYVTNDVLNNPWDSIPPYLAEEAALLAGGVVTPQPATNTPTRIPTIVPTIQPTFTRTPTPTRRPTNTPIVAPTNTPIAAPAMTCFEDAKIKICYLLK
jgi:hypothetical protein